MKQKGALEMKDIRIIYSSVEEMVRIPESVTCPKCGGQIGLWTESIITICWFCGFHLFRKEAIIN
ncbi:MAG: hypothetical protein HZB31_09030 [Nitrospirae bacterium]|nr:hypothetical protein [Nitrospirota bacterium]